MLQLNSIIIKYLSLQYSSYTSIDKQIFKIRVQDQIIDATLNTNNIDLKKIISEAINMTGGLRNRNI